MEDELVSLTPYEDLALGTRFKFFCKNKSYEQTWVKLSHDGKIAQWDDKQQINRWLGQHITSMDLIDPDYRFVEVIR